MSENSAYTVSLPVFEGPLDLLLHLIDEQELDIYDIPIAQITEQYLAYVRTLRELDLEMAGEFLVMAATLMEIKARMLLPSPSAEDGAGEEAEDADPREELVRRLVEYRRFKALAQRLHDLERQHMLTYPRVPQADGEQVSDWVPVEGVSLLQLVCAFRKVLESIEDEHVAEVIREKVTVTQRMRQIEYLLDRGEGCLTFVRLFRGDRTRLEVVITFLALLELIRLGRVRCEQKRAFGEIRIFRARGGDSHGEG